MIKTHRIPPFLELSVSWGRQTINKSTNIVISDSGKFLEENTTGKGLKSNSGWGALVEIGWSVRAGLSLRVAEIPEF